MDRLEFIKRTGALLAAGAFSPVLSNNLFARSKGANDRINVALIGCRNMGWGDLNDALLIPEVRCVALCDIDRQILYFLHTLFHPLLNIPGNGWNIITILCFKCHIARSLTGRMSMP